jgi:hypothetical protein
MMWRGPALSPVEGAHAREVSFHDDAVVLASQAHAIR